MMKGLADKLTQWIKDQITGAGAKGAVVGLSGGIDSAVVAALCKRAFPENVLGVIMPCFSNPEDAKDAKLVAETLGVPYEEVVLNDPFAWFVRRFTGQDYDVRSNDMAIANIKPRLRMITLYYFAAKNNYLVVGTGNKAETVVGYFTKYGDGGVDILPIANLVKSQVRELAQELGVPRQIIDRTPSAGLWHGHCDEKEMGVTYEELDRYILTGEASPRVKEIIDTLHRKSEHKRHLPPTPPVFE
ncbi:NAD(+) synthase [Desulfotomaculum nigrificans]|uniref:NAD(+) synthase n=1 Tax=Desulfotomaculum nigrificans TaxID=1565 RepID=UPI0001FADFDF|nr:NAD(+) synthase [Desulfotomaculum nigrificans]